MNLETVADFGKTPFIYVFVVKYFLNSLSCPIYAKQFLLINTFQKLYYPLVRGWLFVSVIGKLGGNQQ